MEYIQGEGDSGTGCVFCEIAAGQRDDLVLSRGSLCYVVLNKFPYNPGHMLVVPNRHTRDFDQLTSEENAELQALIQQAVTVLKKAAEPDGFNIGMNLGRVGGAGIPDHLHWHVMPRWSGDTNFTTTVGETRILPELLADTAARLAPFFDL